MDASAWKNLRETQFPGSDDTGSYACLSDYAPAGYDEFPQDWDVRGITPPSLTKIPRPFYLADVTLTRNASASSSKKGKKGLSKHLPTNDQTL